MFRALSSENKILVRFCYAIFYFPFIQKENPSEKEQVKPLKQCRIFNKKVEKRTEEFVVQ